MSEINPNLNDSDYDEYDECESYDSNVDDDILESTVSQQEHSQHETDDLTISPPALVIPNVSLKHEHENCNVWEYREGGAHNESEYEFELFNNYLRLGSGRSIRYTANLYKISFSKLHEISKRNNWKYRSKRYDNECVALTHDELDKLKVRDHQAKLEKYRQHQEYLANQASHMAMKLLVINMRKIDAILENEEELSVIDVSNLGALAHKMAHLGKELGAQALGVDALLEAIEDSSMQE